MLDFWHPTLELNTGRFETFPAAGLLTPILTIDGRNVAHIVIMIEMIEHDEHVMDMNGVRHRASEQVQRAGRNVVGMIEEPDLSAGHPQIPFEEETTMLKTISAALLAVSVIAAPALAAGTGKLAQAHTTKTAQAPAIKHTQAKFNVLNAKAQMGRHHHRHYRHHHHHMGALKSHSKLSFKPVAKSHSKVSFGHSAPAAKRG
jgi:hypothetical protein